MDQEIVKSLDMMKIDAVIIKGKIAGIKKPVEIVMDQTTFNEWKGKLQANSATKHQPTFWEAFIAEFNKLTMMFKKKK